MFSLVLCTLLLFINATKKADRKDKRPVIQINKTTLDVQHLCQDLLDQHKTKPSHWATRPFLPLTPTPLVLLPVPSV